MLEIPVIRWGKPYESLESTEVVHFNTGEPIAKVSSANAGLLARDMKKVDNARKILRQFSVDELIGMVGAAADLFEHETLNIGSGTQSPDEFVLHQSASTGLPEHMCRSNMTKNCFVMRNMREILECLTRGLDFDILSRGYGMESRGVVVSYQAQASVLGAVLPSNSPGVHTLWLPVIPLQMGLVLKPGSSEPWTAYRVTAAFEKAGIPPEVICLYPGGHDVGGALLTTCRRSMIFGSQKTVDQYAGNPGVQVHGPGFSKIFLGDDCVDDWEQYIDMMVESVYINGGRSCINCSNIYASRHTMEIAQALAERLGPVDALPPEDPNAGLAAFTTEGVGKAVAAMVQQDLDEDGVTDCTAAYGDRLVEQERCSYIRPIVAHAANPECGIASKEFMFPFVSVVQCPQDKMIKAAGPTLVGSAITNDHDWIEALTDATTIDRLNIGPIPTNRLNWLQPHEGNLIDFLFRSRAYQVPAEKLQTFGLEPVAT
ncbi:MAG: aldehyde dehydrogenase family protein [Planctomycetota bacterium]